MRKIATILFAVFIFVSCTKDHNDVINTELEGKWTLTNVSCFCGFGENPNFSNHKITFAGSILNVENSGENQFLTDAAGSYTVNGNVITLKNGQQYTYVIIENKLELTFVDQPNIADDEIFLEYERD
jgi:hypothetical protein